MLIQNLLGLPCICNYFQGSYGTWKTWKVLEFKHYYFQVLDNLEKPSYFNRSWKTWKNACILSYNISVDVRIWRGFIYETELFVEFPHQYKFGGSLAGMDHCDVSH